MTWQDSILKPEQVKFNLKVNRNDNRNDLTIPLHGIFELQARRSFAAGVAEGIYFVGKAIKAGNFLDDDDFLAKQMTLWGLAEEWKDLQKRVKE